jgi:hypothetical protein
LGRKKNNDRLRTLRQLDRLKWETAEHLGLADDVGRPRELTAREAGKLGDQVAKRSVKQGEQAIRREGARKAEKNL